MTEQEKIELFQAAFIAENEASLKLTTATAKKANRLRRKLFKAVFSRDPQPGEDYNP